MLKKLSDIPIKQKLMRVILLTCGTVLLLTYASFLVYELVTYRQVTKIQLSTIGKIIATNSTAALAFDSPQEGREILQALQAEKEIVAAGLYDQKGRLFSFYPDSLSPGDFPILPDTDRFYFTASFLEGFQPVVQDDQRLGTLYIKMSVNAIYDRMQLYGLIAFGLTALSFLLAYSLSRQLQKVISGPILSLAQTAKTISQEFDYSVRVKKYGNDEVGLLTDAFNNMLRQIEEQNLKILSFNQSLEKMVGERTRELVIANQELKRKNDFVETIIDSSVHIIAVLDTELRYTTVNKKFEQVYQVDRRDIIGKSYVKLFPQTVGSTIHTGLVEALNGKMVYNTFSQSVIIPGYFETYCVPLKEGEVVYGALLIAHDVTNIVEANEKLRYTNEELLKSNMELEQFAYVASHDLQEPLRKIQVFTDLLSSKPHNQSDTKKYLERIHASAFRMTSLIKDLLSYSRLSRKEEVYVETDLNSIIESVKTDFEMLIQQKGATIICAELPKVKGIPHQLGQLFANLISNALKFCQQAPVIRITSDDLPENSLELYPTLQKGQKYWEIKVMDNGIGFDQQYSQKIFTIFQRLNNQSTYSGTGIGLAICRKIVENHQGAIAAHSQQGQGATFVVILPYLVMD